MNIVFVCTGNTCRSPLAEGYLKSFGLRGVNVKSRGIFADGSAVSENSAEIAKEYGFDIGGHISSPITTDDLGADMIICMSHSHKEMLLSMGAAEEKLSVLGDGIDDPYGGNLTVYRYCANQIFDSIDRMVFGGVFTDFSIVSAKESHIKDIAKIEKEVFSTPWSEEAILDSIKNGYYFFAAVDEDENTLGYAGLSIVLDEGYIANVAVDPKFRKMGVGTLLVRQIFSLAREKGLSFVTLEVRASNENAISLYEKCGFKTEGRRKNFYSEPKEDAIIMTRRFSRQNDNSKH